MEIQITAQSLTAYILVFCRMTGMIVLNPLLSRKNIPAKLRIALALGLTLLITPTVGNETPVLQSDLALVFAMTKELFVGFVCGFVFQLFYYMLFFAGDIMDYGFGLSMAKVFDPGTSIQMSMSGNLIQTFFVLYLFATNSHLLMIKIFATSYMIIPPGAVSIGGDIGQFMIQMFVNVFSLAMRLVFPFMAATFMLEIAMGILMKLIPQINVFVINLQSEIILGLILLFMFSGPIASFVDNYMNLMFKTMEQALYALQ